MDNDKGDDWLVIRRRKKKTSGDTSKQVKTVQAIPVQQSGFEALRERDPAEELRKDKERERKRLSRLKSRAAKRADAEQDSDDEVSDDAPVQQQPKLAAPSTRPPTQTIARTHPSSPKLSGEIWLLQVLYAIIAWFRSILGLDVKRRPKGPSKLPAAKLAAAQLAAKAVDTQPLATKADMTASVTTTTAPTIKTPPVVQRSSVQQASGSKQLPRTSTAPLTDNQPPSSLPHPTVTLQPSARVTQAPHVAPPVKTTGPATKCDKDWLRGQFKVCEVKVAHADVVSACALAGELALTAGHDGALKVWRVRPGHMPVAQKNLTGHTGRVEAVALDQVSNRAVSTGRDSSLKVWNINTWEGEATGLASQELASYYVYQSVHSCAVQWGPTAIAALGARSGNISLYILETGQRVSVLKEHQEEITALSWPAGDSLLWSGSADGRVCAWDPRSTTSIEPVLGSWHAARGRVSSLFSDDHTLFVGDYSSVVKVFDVRMLRTHGPEGVQPIKVPNAPSFAGDACPVAACGFLPAAGVLVTSSIAWWAHDMEVLTEAGDDSETPEALLNMHAFSGLQHEHLYTLRLGPSIVTCMAQQGDQLLCGASSGSLFSATLVRGGSANTGVLGKGVAIRHGLVTACEELSDSDEDEDE